MADEVDWNAEREMDPVIDAMMAAKVPLTRENYIDAKYGSEDRPEDWTEEHEASLPAPFQRGAGRV